MAKDKVQAEEPAAGPLNRQQRRHQKFSHAHDAPQDNLRPQSENNSAFTTPARPDMEEGPKDAVAVSGTDGPTDLTGPGTGGATENDERTPHHSGVHVSRSAKG